MKTEEQYDVIVRRIIMLLNTDNRSEVQEEELLNLYQQIENHTIFDFTHFSNSN